MKRKALGKGLRSIIPEAPAKTPPPTTSGDSRASAGLRQIDIDLIRPNPKQPRHQLDKEALEALAGSLEDRGVLQPVLVRPLADGRYELVAGERRWRAAQQAGLLKIPAIVLEVPDDRLLETALVENIQREDLNPIDEAMAYDALLKEAGLTQEELARRVRKRRATVANSLRLLGLSKAVQEMVRSGALAMGHARALVPITDPAEQKRLASRAAKEGLSVRQVERMVSRLSRRKGPEAVRTEPRRDPNVVAAEESLQKAMGTKVRIVQGKRGGRIELHCFSGEELNRVYDLLMKAANRGGGATKPRSDA